MRFLAVVNLLLALGCSRNAPAPIVASAPATPEKPPVTITREPLSPLEQFKAMIFIARDNGTAEEAGELVGTDRFLRRKLYARNLNYDVKKTDSLVSPFVATVEWQQRTAACEPTLTYAEALQQTLPDPTDSTATWDAIFAYQDSRWILKSLRLKVGGETLIDDGEPDRQVNPHWRSYWADWSRHFGGLDGRFLSGPAQKP